ncbi:MAG TPA: PHP domain-containing protein [Clostridiales bacterium]|nr:PHP domain-containing protein [Clostridiales bacterium]
MDKIFYDLHIHSCLSPCGDEDMTPANIIAMSKLKNLDLIAVTDHNSCRNCPSVMTHGMREGILVIPGMELCTQEEVHVLCLFARLKDAMDFDAYVYDRLIKIENVENIFGRQQIYDENDSCVGMEPNLLINATEISFDELGDLMDEFHGIYIPAHIDKNSNSLLLNLGFIPPTSKFSWVEVKDITRLEKLKRDNPYLKQCDIINNSDAHSLGLINEAVNQLTVKEKSIEGVWDALHRI